MRRTNPEAMTLEARRRKLPLIEVNKVSDYVMTPKSGLGMLQRRQIT